MHKNLDIMQDLVVVSPDAGFAKTARKYADYLQVPVAIGDKTRTAHDENAHILELIGNVDGKNCMIVDDFKLRDGRIHLAAFFRSHDFCGAYPANLYGLARLLQYVAERVGAEPGSISTTSASAVC